MIFIYINLNPYLKDVRNLYKNFSYKHHHVPSSWNSFNRCYFIDNS